MERNKFTTPAIILFTNLFSHMFPLPVRNNNNPRRIPRINVASTEIAVMYAVCRVASHIDSHLTLGNNDSVIRNHLRFNTLGLHIIQGHFYHSWFPFKEHRKFSIRTILCMRNLPLNNVDFYIKFTNQLCHKW